MTTAKEIIQAKIIELYNNLEKTRKGSTRYTVFWSSITILKSVVREIEEAEKQNAKDEALNQLIGKLEEIDPCEFASYTLCLIKEKAEEVRKE